MVSAGATCLSSSAVSLPPPHCQTIPSKYPAPKSAMAMSAAMVDELRERLLLIVKNGDETAAKDVITQLENAALSKEILEATRIGRYINDVRKQTTEKWPDFSKRCRAIIKQWQKLAEYRPSSSCEGSSNGGTPQLISPALRRGLTPRTPGKTISQPQRVTSTDLPPPDARNTGRQLSAASISPANRLENGMAQQPSGSYAPLDGAKMYPHGMADHQLAKQMSKSASVGAALFLPDGEGLAHAESTNGKQMRMVNGTTMHEHSGTDGPLAGPSSAMLLAHQPPLMLKLKRSASGVQRLTAQSSTDSSTNGVSPSGSMQQSIVQAARKNVQSTAELMAQLSEQLPQHIGRIFDVDANINKEQQETSKISPALSTALIPSSTDSIAEPIPGTSKRRKKTPEMEIILEGCEENEKSTDNQLKTNQSSDHMLESSSHSQPKSALVDVASDQPKAKRKRGRPKKESNQAIASESTGTAALPKEMPNHRTTQFNWFTKFPLLPEEQQQESMEIPTQIYQELDRSFVLPIHDRQLLLMPYLDTGHPDFLVHDLPEQDRFHFPNPYS